MNDGTQDASSTIAEALGGAAPRAIRSDLKSDRVAVELERRILMGGLEPGDRLPTEDALSQMFGVSRSVIRDAVRRLVANGLGPSGRGAGRPSRNRAMGRSASPRSRCWLARTSRWGR